MHVDGNCEHAGDIHEYGHDYGDATDAISNNAGTARVPDPVSVIAGDRYKFESLRDVSSGHADTDGDADQYTNGDEYADGNAD